ncbi:MAG: metallophosphoesterase, partial [Actinomycetota bacterium]|nr:metallophosphoesterase [Actinomycetota bacterium]
MKSPRILISLLVGIIALWLGACDTPPEPRAPEQVAPVEDPTFGLVVIGDYGTGEEEAMDVAGEVREWVEAHGTDALVTTGDNVYPEAEPEYFDRAWVQPYGWVQDEGLAVVASLGNHDVDAEDEGRAVMELLDMPHRWYVRSIGDADIFALDANQPEDEEQLAWLEDALASSKAAWKIAVFHQPVFSCAKHDGTPDIVEEWVPIFEDNEVDLVLNGHDHTYQ